MLKKLLLVSILATAPVYVFAATLHIGGDYFLKGSERIQDDIYAVGETATFAGRVDGDAVSLGGSVVNDGDISGDALFIGQDVMLRGKVSDDARLVGETVTIGGEVTDDVVAIGAEVIVLPTAHIGGDLSVVGRDVTIQGSVAGNVKILADSALMQGAATGTVEAWGTLALSDTARIGGDLIYHAPRELSPHAGVVRGSVIFDHAGRSSARAALLSPFAGGFFALHTLMALAVAFALFFFARARTEEVLLDILPQFGRRLLRGILLMLLAPALIALLIGSIVGIPLGAVCLAFFVSILVLAPALAGILVGAWVEQRFFRRSPFPLSYRPVLLGTLVFWCIGAVPVAGFAIELVIAAAAVGSLGTLVYRRLREIRY